MKVGLHLTEVDRWYSGKNIHQICLSGAVELCGHEYFTVYGPSGR